MVAGGRAGEKEGGGGGKERRKRLHEEKKKKKKTEGGKSDTTTPLTHLQVLGQFLLRQRRRFGRGDTRRQRRHRHRRLGQQRCQHLVPFAQFTAGRDAGRRLRRTSHDGRSGGGCHDGRGCSDGSCCRWRRQWRMLLLLLLLPGHQLIRRRTQQLVQDPASACGHHQVVGVQHRLFTRFHVFTSLFAVTFRPSLLLLLHADAKDAANDAARRTAANASAEIHQPVTVTRGHS